MHGDRETQPPVEPTVPAAEPDGPVDEITDVLRADTEDALAAARHKQQAASVRLAEAHDEAQSLISDATHQAMLVSQAAELAAEQLLAEARAEAEELVASARATAKAFRGQAEELVQAAEREAESRLTDQVGELAEQRAEHARQLAAEQDRTAARAEQILADADGLAARRLAEAGAEADQAIRAARRRAEQIAAGIEADRAAGAEQSRALVQQARDDAAAELARAAEQISWTQQTVAGLLEAAELEARRITSEAHGEASATVHQVRLRLRAVLASSGANLRQRRGALAAESQATHRQIEQQLAEARDTADQLRARARAEAEQLLAEARDQADQHHERAERRLAEAESGARAVRERVAEQVGASQRELHQLRRTTRAEATELMASARAEADELRAAARQVLADARSEVASLARRRDAITAELGQLSGVIEALAVAEGRPDEPATGRPDRSTEPGEPARPRLANRVGPTERMPARTTRPTSGPAATGQPSRSDSSRRASRTRPAPGPPSPLRSRHPRLHSSPTPYRTIRPAMTSMMRTRTTRPIPETASYSTR